MFFAREVLPLIRQIGRGARFLIVGRNPGKNVLRIAANCWRGGDGVRSRCDGLIWPKPMLRWLRFPLRRAFRTRFWRPWRTAPGGGHLAHGAGLSPGVADLVAMGDTAQELSAETVVLLLKDPQLARRSRGMEGRRRVKAEYSWETSLDYLLQLVENPGTRGPRRRTTRPLSCERIDRTRGMNNCFTWSA